MFDAQTTALLRAILDDVCQTVARSESGTRTHVAAKILEAARQGETTPDSLMQVGRKALNDAPTMWR
jgi:urease gamma subunit